MADDYLTRRAAEYRAAADDAVREPLCRVKAGRRELAITLATHGATDDYLELALWSPQGPPGARTLVERGRVQLFEHEVDALLERLTEARARLRKAARR